MLPEESYPISAYGARGFYTSNDKSLLNYPDCDTIFKVDSLSLTPYCVLKAGTQSLKSCFKANGINRKTLLVKNREYRKGKNHVFDNVMLLPDYFEDNKLKKIEFKINHRYYSFIQGKNEKHAIYGKLKNDLLGSAINFKSYNHKYGTIGYIVAEGALSTDLDVLERNSGNVSQQLQDDIKNADPEGNPIIVFLK